MRILIEQGILDMRNLGQNALLQAALERVQRLWPGASIGVTTFAPQVLKLFFPEVAPVRPDGSNGWGNGGDEKSRLQRFIAPSVIRNILEVREGLWYRWPALRPALLKARVKAWFRSTSKHTEPQDNPRLPAMENQKASKPDYENMLCDVDVFIATGSQYMCDHARDTAFRVMDGLEAAIQRGIPTAMVGQGMGPIQGAELRSRAKEVLPRVDLFLVRERLEAPDLLVSLGVDPEKILVTGDDAIELAYNGRASTLGNGIGISMRCMPSTKVGEVDIPVLNKALVEAASKYDAWLVGLPISLSIHERDDLCTLQLMEGYKKTWMRQKSFQTPLEYIRDLQRCRLVVAGTFHGALLALAQGIPVICVVRSSLYANKFQGLADLFNPGCVILFLDDQHFQEKLVTAIDSIWQSAENLRVQLLNSSALQIEWANLAYQRLFEMVKSKNCPN